ncbi:MAG: hypothetical protein ACR2RF_15920 [Geminicoccaceae bacterium]
MTSGIQCQHSDVHFDINQNHFGDTNVSSLDLTATCKICGVRFKFLGLPVGVSMAKPTVSVDGYEVKLPMVASNEKPDSKLGAFLKFEGQRT